ncbi:MAG: hypothetical protein HY055_13960 [Magnetospirillum sp.]|nr:hypothetical protein [Magnetospirillum sp.]
MISSPNRPGLSVVVLAALGLAYPFVVYFSQGRIPAGALVLAALILVAARLWALRRAASAHALMPALAMVFAITGILGLVKSETAALAYPVLMSLGMSVAFGLSLLRPPCLVQCFAALTEPDPSPAATAYMRKVNLVWTLFLGTNAAVSAFTAYLGDMAVWTLYNGLVSYLLMGILFAVEYAVRRRARAREARP